MKDKPMIYLAGDMLNRGAQLQRAEEKAAIQALGYPLYVPQDNKEINDKANLDSNDGLAERIVKADTQGIKDSGIVVMEAREAALGTCIELGQIKGMRDAADEIIDMMCAGAEYDEILEYCIAIKNKKILVHNSDIRRQGNPTETGDFRSYGPHQYMKGVVDDVTEGVGYREFDEIVDILERL